MAHLRDVFRFELVSKGRRRAYLFTTFVLPVLIVLAVFGVQAYLDFRATREVSRPAEDEPEQMSGKVGYVDLTGEFQEPGLFGTALVRYEAEEEALAAMRARDVDTVYIILADYMDSGLITRYVNEISLEAMAADTFFQSFLTHELFQDVDRELVRRVQHGLRINEHVVAPETGEASAARNEETDFWLIYVFALLLAFATFFAGGYLLQSVIEEKETRMLEIILSTVRPFPLLTGKVLAAGLLGFIQVVVWGLCAAFAMSRLAAVVPAMSQLTVEPGLVVWMVVYFIAGYCMFAGAYASIGALSQSMREGPQMVAVITLPAMLPFYFISVIAEWPNAALPVAMSLFPITAPIGMIQRLAVTDVPPIEIAISLTLVLLTAVGLLWLAARLFRVQTLLAGQAPRWRDILRIVRET